MVLSGDILYKTKFSEVKIAEWSNAGQPIMETYIKVESRQPLKKTARNLKIEKSKTKFKTQ